MPPRNFIARASSFIPSAMVAIALLVAAHRVHAQTVAADTSYATDVRDAAETVRANSSDNLPEGLEKSDWSSIRAAYEAGRHKAFAVDGGYQARNPGQRWITRFDGRGFSVQPDGGGWTWGLQLERYGFAGSEHEVCEPVQVSASGQRIAYDWDATLQEWWINDTRGLEHGYTVRERPDGGGAGPLMFTLAVRGDSMPRVLAAGQSVSFADCDGADVLTYSKLVVTDADGRSLAARFERSGAQLRLSIDEGGARYPLTIDPLAQQAYLKASNSENGDWFGRSVCVSGDTIVVGAPNEDSNATGVNGNPSDNSAPDSGAAYVFVRTGSTWSQDGYLKASNTGSGDAFGFSVSVSGDTIVVGAYGEDSGATGVNGNEADNSAGAAGAAYVFVRTGSTWSQEAYLKASNTGASDTFGISTSVSGDTVVVGARSEDSSATGVNGNQADNSAGAAGAAYVFVRTGSTWSQDAYLKASNTGASDTFGCSVSVSGDTIVVGALFEQSGATGVNGNQTDNSESSAGAAYVFVRTGSTWSQEAYLKASNARSGDIFGASVSVSGDTIVVGAYGEDSGATGVNGNEADNSAPSAGAAFVFVRSGTTWSQQAYLKASNTGTSDSFGCSVSVSGDTIVVGAQLEDSGGTGVNGNDADNSADDAGAAYVFVRTGLTWSQEAYLKASNTGGGDYFGISTSASGDTIVVGAHLEDSGAAGVNGNQADNSAGDAGAAYVFVRGGSTWSQEAYVKASNSTTNAGDEFGIGVAVSGDTVVVGAFYEDSNATGVNGNHSDNFAPDSGAAYVFVRSGGTWIQQAYLKASNTQASDYFGRAVSISGDTIVVGAEGEDSNATGSNGNQADNSVSVSGAAYVFVRTGTTWTQQAYLKASNTDASDSFGYALSLSGDTVVVGAYNEASNAVGVNGNQTDNSASGAGAVYVFVRSGTTWSQQAYLKASNTSAGDFFGLSLSVSGDTLVAGAYSEDSNATGVNGNQNDNSAPDSGATYVFARSGTTWSQQAYLKASNTGASDRFGVAVSVAGDSLVIGAESEDSSATGVNGNQADNSASSAGAVYVFVRFGTSWSQEAYLKASNAGADDYFGSSLAVSGDRIVVGAYQEDSNSTGVNGDQANNGALDAGAAYVYTRIGTSWSQSAYLKASSPDAGDYFGLSVAVSADTVAVGALYEDSNASGVNGDPTDNSAVDSGAAYIFTVDIGTSGPGAFCAGDGMLIDHTTQCPCGNNGTPGNGCGHSFDPNGANLSVTGLAANDDVVLHSSFEPVNSFTLFMQHDAAGDRLFHDGVLCANGALIRLRGRSAMAGEAFFPNSLFANDSTLTLSSRGGVFPGQGVRRYYAAWYRNASMTFCPPATANVTNGWIVDW